MIYTHKTITQKKVKSDVCIIGTGAGGSACAYQLSKNGFNVVLLEVGSFLIPNDFSQKEELMYPKLFYGKGGRRTKNRAIRVLHGHGVGGSTLHNINLCKKVPKQIVKDWKLKDFTFERFAPYLEKVEKDLGVHQIPNSQMNMNNQILKTGIEKLGYQGGQLSHNRKGCIGSGFCELGCAFDAKMNAMRVYIPEVVKNGGRVFANTKALRFDYKKNKIKKLYAQVMDPDLAANSKESLIEFDAKVFICAGGAIETPALLQRSNIPDPNKNIGSNLHLHPGVAVAGVFNQKVNSWKGVPQSYECTEFLSFDHNENKRVWIVPGSAHPVGVASLLPGFGKDHYELMQNYPYIAPLTAMIHDETKGRVSAQGKSAVEVDYNLNLRDRKQLALGLKECAKILLAAGANKVVIPYQSPLVINNIEQLEDLELEVKNHDIDIVAVHPMSSVPMGENKIFSCLNTKGRYHHIDNLYVADASVYPTSLGIPPQITTYATGLYVGDQVKNELS